MLAFIYGRIYFPTYSNGLKEIAAFLGFNWPDREATGAYSIAWRHQWEESMTPGVEQKLRTYNPSDCEALEFVVKALWRLPCPEESKQLRQTGDIAFVSSPGARTRLWFRHPSRLRFSDFQTRHTDAPKFDRGTSRARRMPCVPLRWDKTQGQDVRTVRVRAVRQTGGLERGTDRSKCGNFLRLVEAGRGHA